MPYLVMQQEVDGQRRPLEQPGLQVGRHPRLPGQNRLKPQCGSIARYGLTERLAFLVCRLDRIAEGKRRLPARVGHRADRGARSAGASWGAGGAGGAEADRTDGPAWTARHDPLTRAGHRSAKARRAD